MKPRSYVQKPLNIKKWENLIWKAKKNTSRTQPGWNFWNIDVNMEYQEDRKYTEENLLNKINLNFDKNDAES